jgi:hypothetical protein
VYNAYQSLNLLMDLSRHSHTLFIHTPFSRALAHTHTHTHPGPLNPGIVAKMAGATFTVLQTEQCQFCSPNGSGAEVKMAAAAAQIRAVNPTATVLLYFPVDQVRAYTSLGAWFDSQPAMLIKNLTGGVVRPNGVMAVPDYGQASVVAAWATGVAKAVAAGGFDGVFIDGEVRVDASRCRTT